MTTIVAFAIMTINLNNVTTDVNMTLMAIAIIRIAIAKSTINILSIITMMQSSASTSKHRHNHCLWPSLAQISPHHHDDQDYDHNADEHFNRKH